MLNVHLHGPLLPAWGPFPFMWPFYTHIGIFTTMGPFPLREGPSRGFGVVCAGSGCLCYTTLEIGLTCCIASRWWFGVVSVRVNLRRTRLVLGWVTVRVLYS